MAPALFSPGSPKTCVCVCVCTHICMCTYIYIYSCNDLDANASQFSPEYSVTICMNIYGIFLFLIFTVAYGHPFVLPPR